MPNRTENSRRAGPSQRQLRVGEALRHALAGLLGAGTLRDPALRDASITVTEVQMSADLRHATVYVMPLGGAHIEAILEGLKRATPHLRARLAGLVRLKFAPDLRFEADATFERAERLERLLRDAPPDG